jgi:hypothetical protein
MTTFNIAIKLYGAIIDIRGLRKERGVQSAIKQGDPMGAEPVQSDFTVRDADGKLFLVQVHRITE